MATTIPILGTFGGLGATQVHDPQSGRYTITTNATTRFGKMTAGLLEEADATGIAAGDRVVKVVGPFQMTGSANTYRIALAHDIANGDTHIYHKLIGAGAWTAFHPTGGDTGTAVFAGSLATDVVIWKDAAGAGQSYIIVAFGTTSVWHYNTLVTKNTWVANTLSNDNSEYMTKAYVQETGLETARLIWAVSPSTSLTMTGIEVYDMTLLSSPPLAGTKTTIDTDQNTYVTSITLGDLGDILIGTKTKLYTFDDLGLPVVLAGPYAVSNTEAGAQASPLNFERYVTLPDNSVLYVIEGYKLLRIRSGADPVTLRDPKNAPRDQVYRFSGSLDAVPRVNLPISAITMCGEWIVLALTYSSSAAPRTVANQPGGTTLLQNTLTDGASEIYVGKLDDDRITWWGSELTTLDAGGAVMRVGYLWYEAETNYLYLCSAEAESADHQQRRCYFFTDDPYGRTVSSAIKLSAGTPSIEFAPFDIDGEYSPKGGGLITIDAQSLTSTSTCTVAIRPQPDYDTSTAFTTLAVFSSAAIAERGVHVGRSTTFDKLRVRVTLGAGSGTAFPRFNGGAVTLHPLRERQAVGAI